MSLAKHLRLRRYQDAIEATAVQWTGDNLAEMPVVCRPHQSAPDLLWAVLPQADGGENWHLFTKGMWVISAADGRVAACFEPGLRRRYVVVG